MNTPDVIYLIDVGDEITWCNHPNPTGEVEPGDVVRYEKASVKLTDTDLLELLLIARHYARYSHNDYAKVDLEKIDAAIKTARGEQ
jgi:hypothetical protein